MPSRTLVFDIETAAKDLAGFDEYSRELLERIFKWDKEKDADLLDEERFRLAFSPLTSEVVAIAALDADSGRGGVYFQSGEKKIVFEEGPIKFESGDEVFLLKKFWELASIYDEFVTFAGRTFDVPILMLRSAILGMRPSKNLMVNRYIDSQPSNARHIDLKDQFSFYGAKYERLGLHFWCKAFGISSPKMGEVEGKDVSRLFREGEYEKIARYCLGDVIATLELFRKWEKFLRF
jgi:DNA polymerase elongation subunit (family B)